MPAAWETVSATQPATATVTTITFSADPLQTLQIRSANGTPAAFIQSVWTDVGGACDITIHSPRMHDNVAGVKLRAPATNSTPLTGKYFTQPMYSQDTPTIQGIFASAPNAVENLGYCVYYPDLPGSAANLITPEQMVAQMKQWWSPTGGYLGVHIAPTSSGTAGDLGAGVALTSTENNFKANSWYALLGYVTTTQVNNIQIQGPDTANLMFGGPGAVDPLVTRNWFVDLSISSGVAAIPVINSANAAGTNLFVSDRGTSTAPIIDLLFAYLGPSAAGTTV